MRFQQHLNEVLNKPTKDIKIEYDKKDELKAKFYIKSPNYKHPLIFNIYIEKIDDYHNIFFLYNDDHYDIQNLGINVALQVFTTVKKITTDYVKKHKVRKIRFSAKEPSRIKLYRKFIKMFKNWKSREEKDYDGELMFFLDK